MKVVAFNGSPRREGNTSILLRTVCEELEKEGIETETVQIGGRQVHGCTACMKCFENLDKRCVIDTDFINDCIQKMVEADGIIIGTPTYFTDVSVEVKALIDRAGFVSIANGGLLSKKAGAAVVAVRRGGAVHAYDTINHLFGISGMFTVGSNYWNFGMGLMPGDVKNDAEGLETMRTLAQNMAWFLQKTRA